MVPECTSQWAEYAQETGEWRLPVSTALGFARMENRETLHLSHSGGAGGVKGGEFLGWERLKNEKWLIGARDETQAR